MEMLRTSRQGITVKSCSNKLVQYRNADTELPVRFYVKKGSFE
jgi:hypothetical protein